MVDITFIEYDGTKHILDAEEGDSVMEVAVNAGLRGIDGECGGSCSCATCHVHVSKEYWGLVGEPGEIEKEMLECAENLTDTSRLGCQIEITDELDGMVINLLEKQG